MRLLFTTLLLLLTINFLYAQNVGIGTTVPKASAQLDIESNNKGILIPRMSNVQRAAIAGPAKGLMVYDTTYSSFFYYDGGKWRPMYERNYDSTTIDYSSSASDVQNLGTINGSSSVVPFTLNSGFIYDNGGPTGNYLPNVTSGTTLAKDDSTVFIKISIEEMSAEDKVDYLYLITGQGATADTIKRSGSQRGDYTFNSDVRIVFNANATIQQAGFKIRWSRVRANSSLQTPIPQYGWHFDARKMAAMGGVQEDNNWNKDSLGFGSLSYGIGAKAKGDHAIGLGRQVYATGLGAISLGYQSKANANYSTAIGWDATANATGSTAIGIGIIATTPFTTYVGAHNAYITPDPINPVTFVVGNGRNSTLRSNALKIFENGNTELNGDLTVGTTFTPKNIEVSGDLSVEGELSLGGTTKNLADVYIGGVLNTNGVGFLMLTNSLPIGNSVIQKIQAGTKLGQLLIIQHAGGNGFYFGSYIGGNGNVIPATNWATTLLLEIYDTITFIWNGNYWVQLSHSDNQKN